MMFAVLVACGAPIPPATAPTRETPRSQPAVDRAPVDPLPLLAPAEGGAFTQLSPSAIRLALDGAVIEGVAAAQPIEVAILESLGGRVRAGVRLPHARFAVWAERTQLLAVLARDQRLRIDGVFGPSKKHATLRAGAFVTRLAREDRQVKVRYRGALEVEGWLAAEALAETTTRRNHRSRIPQARQTTLVSRGAQILATPNLHRGQLALVVRAHLLDVVATVDAAWSEVAYVDGDVRVEGYWSRRTPPGRLTARQDPELAPLAITPNAKAPSGTCLYARDDGDPIGYLVGDQDVLVEPGDRPWSSLSIDTPWGAIAFGAQVDASGAWTRCAPEGAAPPSTLAPAPSAP